MNDAFVKLRARKAVFKQTKPLKDLPKVALYLEWMSGQGARRVVDTDGKEHVIQDATLQSHYKLVTGGQAKKLIDEHWQKLQIPPAS